MAKNKNRKHGGQQARPSAGDRAAGQSEAAAPGVNTDATGGQGGTDRKQQRRFGHN